MADQEAFDPVAAGAVAVEEPKFDPTQHGAIPVQEQQSSGLQKGLATAQQALGYAQKAYMGAIAPGFAVEEALYPSVMRKFEAPLVSPETATGIVHALNAPQRLATIAFGGEPESVKPYEQAAERFVGEQAAGLTSPENIALLAVGGLAGKVSEIPKLADTAGIAKPETITPASEAAAKEEVIKNATQEREVEGGVQVERPRDDTGRPPETPSPSGGIQPAAEGAAPEAVAPVSGDVQAPAVAEQPKTIGTTVEGGTVEEVQKQEGEKGREGILVPPEAAAAEPSTAAVAPTEPPPPETPEQLGEALGEKPRLAGPSNRVLQERAARSEIPQAPESGHGVLKEDLITKANAQYSPERAQVAAEKISRGESNLDDEAMAVLHEEKLTKASVDAERALKANPNDPALQAAYEVEKSAMSKWQHETIQPMKTLWRNKGVNLQGATDVDTGTLTGLQKLAWDTSKRDFTPKELPIMNEAANRVDKSIGEEKASIAKANEAVQKVLKPSRIMDLNTLRESLAETLKSITC